MKLSKKQVGLIAIGCVLAFILINSMMNGAISQWISELPKKIYQLFIPYGKIKWLDNFLINEIRKFAHFAEYFVLGILIIKFYYYKNKSIQRLVNCIFILFSVSFLDETIQIFSHRQSKITDIWLDLFGALSGMFVYILYRYLKRKFLDSKIRRE